MTDREFEELEKRCKKIKRKALFKVSISIFFILLILSVIYFYGFESYETKALAPIKDVKSETKRENLKDIKQKDIKSAVKSELNATSKISKAGVAKSIDKNISKKEKSKNNQSEDVKKKESEEVNSTIPYDTIFLNIDVGLFENNLTEKSENETTGIRVEKNVSKKVEKVERVEKDKREHKKLNIIVKSLDKERFLKKGGDNFTSNINLARFYFKSAKYDKAIYYAKKASRLSPDSKEPWLIYIKSKIKQGRKKEAIKSLETFLTYFNSQEAESMLIKLRSEK